MGKRLAAVGAAVVITGGGFGVAALNPVQIAGASTAPTAQEAPTAGAKADRTGPLKTVLDKLVADGTLTQTQADKVLDGVKAEVKTKVSERKDQRKERRGELLATAAKAIGSTPEEVTAALKDGTSIAAQAEAEGVSRQTVSDAVAKVLTARIDAAVASGKLTAERGDKAKANVTKAVDRILDADGSHAGTRGHRRGNLRSRLGG